MHGKNGVGKRGSGKNGTSKNGTGKNSTNENLVKRTRSLKITLKELFKDFFQLIYEIQSAY